MLNMDNYDTFCALDELLVDILNESEDWSMDILIPQIETIKDSMFDGLWVVIEA